MSNKMDRITNLPDEVLSHILSFLPTKQAVVTSILSRRWTDLWLSVPTLDFSDTNVTTPEASSHFTHFVDSVLHGRDATQPIQSFRLNSESWFIDFSHVDRWIDFVLPRIVEHFHLKWLGAGSILLAHGILTCKTLVVLKLEGFFFVHVKPSTSVELHSLKILNLERIEFYSFRCFMKFLSGCPNLEDLQINDTDTVNWSYQGESQNKGEFKSLALSKLTRADIINSEVYIPFKAIENIEFLRLEMSKVVHDGLDHAVFHNLTSMELIFFVYDWRLLFQVLKHSPVLQNLVLDETDMDDEEHYIRDEEETWVEPKFVPECFSFHLRTCTIRNFVCLRDELRLAKFIMKNAIVLQTFTICCQGRVRRIKRRLSSYQRGSATCQLLVY